jgi:hypothetical protein
MPTVTEKEIRVELERLARECGVAVEDLDPQVVVAASRNPQSPLHLYFEHDNETAAREYVLSCLGDAEAALKRLESVSAGDFAETRLGDALKLIQEEIAHVMKGSRRAPI